MTLLLILISFTLFGVAEIAAMATILMIMDLTTFEKVFSWLGIALAAFVVFVSAYPLFEVLVQNLNQIHLPF